VLLRGHANGKAAVSPHLRSDMRAVPRLPDRFGHAMGRKDQRRTVRNCVKLANEDRALCCESFDNMAG